MLNKLLITKSTSPEEVTKFISVLREQKGKEKEVLKIINEALLFGHEFVTNLFFEEALTNQHLYMNDNGNKKALIDMQNSVLKAGFYINKFNVTKWQSRLFRFLGRIEDYKKNFKKAIFYYKKSIKYVSSDFEPFRIFELEGFLAYATIQSGKIKNGFNLSKKVFNKFITSKTALSLKKNNFTTWTIWFSSVVINTYNALLDQNVNFDLEISKKWVKIAEDELNSKKDEFLYRKKEISNLKTRINFD
jgi:hypothetical protein